MSKPGITTLDRSSDADTEPWANLLLGGGLQEADLSALLSACRLVQVGSRSPLRRAEDDLALLLIRGTAKSCIVTSDGTEVITEIVGPGFAAGLLAVLGHNETGKDLTSLEPVDALAVTGPNLRHLVRTRSGITAACLRALADQHARANAERSRFAGTCISQRVSQRLLELATRWGQPEGDSVLIDLRLTQEELAAWSGASRESVAKVLQQLRASGLIATGRRTIRILDLPRLRERCEGPTPTDVRQALAALA